jgi:hypothetical protein
MGDITSANASLAKWTPSQSGQPFGLGTYRVSVFIPKRPSAYGIAAVEVYRDGQSEVQKINLADIVSPNGEWIELGVYYFLGAAMMPIPGSIPPKGSIRTDGSGRRHI